MRPAPLELPQRRVTEAECSYSSSRLLRIINAPATSKEGEKAHEARPAGRYTVKSAPLGGAALILDET